MQLIDADTAQAGLTIVAAEQSMGRGQRGRVWFAASGQSLLSSIVCTPKYPIEQQFVFSAAVALAIADELTALYEHWRVAIKWPNDIIINDKKAGGILIENVLRGAAWSYSIVGLGLNVCQQMFPNDLPFATSLKIASGKDYALAEMLERMRRAILSASVSPLSISEVMDGYNSYLFRQGNLQSFCEGPVEWKARVIAVSSDGTLGVETEDGIAHRYTHGVVAWKWE